MLYLDTNEQVRWSFETGDVIYLKIGNGDPVKMSPTPETGNEVWMDVIEERPEEAISGFSKLLGTFVYEYAPDYDPNVVLKRFPNADFSPQAFKRLILSNIIEEVSKTLSETDWLTDDIGLIGPAFVAELKARRQIVREAAMADIRMLNALSPAAYPEFVPQNVRQSTFEYKESLSEVYDMILGEVQ